VLENLRIDPKLMPAKINAALAFCEIESLIDRQLNTLSGGEKQKVALAIVIAMNRDIILLDEPFASIDPQSRAELIAKLVTLRDQQQKTIIIADHDLLGYKQFVDHVYTIHNQTIQTLSHEDGLQLLADFEKQVPAITSTLPIANLDTAFNFDELRIQIQQHALLSQSSLQIPSGKVTLITGENGIGKSTLFLSMAKLMKFSGEIQMNQTNIQKIKAKKYAREVALIFQDSENQFLTVTMREEIELSKQHCKSDYFDDEMITSCLTQLNLNELLDQVVYTLSEGQKKKLQILLMLIVEPEVLLLDEPLKGLDIESIHQIITILNAYRAEHQQTIVMISHQFSGLNQFVDYHLNFANQKLTYVETVS
jgi:energy-coupling factor transport system ATP-binding protein